MKEAKAWADYLDKLRGGAEVWRCEPPHIPFVDAGKNYRKESENVGRIETNANRRL